MWLLLGFWICVIISIAVVIRRLIVLVSPFPGQPAQMEDLDSAFSSHAVLTATHIIPAALFVIIAVRILLRQSNGVWLERVFFSSGTITGVTAYLMSAYAVGGWIERSAVFVFDTYFLFSLGRAYLFRVRGEPSLKREWMIRAVGVLLGIATTRPVMGVLFATSIRTHLGPHQFFGIAFWIGFSINAAVTELWLAKRRRQFRKPGLYLGSPAV
jgi:Predicted membrane protein (DUF2306)